MAAFLDFAKEPFNTIGGANKLPVFFRKAVESQTGFQIALQAGYGGGIDALVFEHKGSHFLLRFFPVGLVEDGSEFRFYQILLFFRDVPQDVWQYTENCVN